MNPVGLFLVGVVLTALLSALAVWYLKSSLQTVLLDLCGTEARASFWTAFSNLTIGLTPVLFAMHYRPEADQPPGIFQIGTQLEWAMGGLLLSVILLGLILNKFIAQVGGQVTRTGA